MVSSNLARIAKSMTDAELMAHADKVVERLDRWVDSPAPNTNAVQANKNILDAMLNELEARDLPVCW